MSKKPAKVICDGRSSVCRQHNCPHRKPHRPHKPFQHESDGPKPCVETDNCFSVHGCPVVRCVACEETDTDFGPHHG